MKHKKMGIEFGYNVDDLMGYIISRLQTINCLKKKWDLLSNSKSNSKRNEEEKLYLETFLFSGHPY